MSLTLLTDGAPLESGVGMTVFGTRTLSGETETSQTSSTANDNGQSGTTVGTTNSSHFAGETQVSDADTCALKASGSDQIMGSSEIHGVSSLETTGSLSASLTFTALEGTSTVTQTSTFSSSGSLNSVVSQSAAGGVTQSASYTSDLPAGFVSRALGTVSSSSFTGQTIVNGETTTTSGSTSGETTNFSYETFDPFVETFMEQTPLTTTVTLERAVTTETEITTAVLHSTTVTVEQGESTSTAASTTMITTESTAAITITTDAGQTRTTETLETTEATRSAACAWAGQTEVVAMLPCEVLVSHPATGPVAALTDYGTTTGITLTPDTTLLSGSTTDSAGDADGGTTSTFTGSAEATTNTFSVGWLMTTTRAVPSVTVQMLAPGWQNGESSGTDAVLGTTYSIAAAGSVTDSNDVLAREAGKTWSRFGGVSLAQTINTDDTLSIVGVATPSTTLAANLGGFGDYEGATAHLPAGVYDVTSVSGNESTFSRMTVQESTTTLLGRGIALVGRGVPAWVRQTPGTEVEPIVTVSLPCCSTVS